MVNIHLLIIFLGLLCIVCICLFIYVAKLRNIIRGKTSRFNDLLLEKIKLDERVNVLSEVEAKYTALQTEYNCICMKASELETQLKLERQMTEEKLSIVQKAEAALADKFSSLSAEALSKNNQSFLELAKTSFETFKNSTNVQIADGARKIDNIANPIKEYLQSVDKKLKMLEDSRLSMCQSISEQINSLICSQDKLKNETYKLSSALKIPSVRGRWGEMQLRRVVEIAGMVKHCDFDEQVTEKSGSGIRPDMIIHLPGNRRIIVDAKTPLSAYMEALESDNDDDKVKHLKSHAKHVRSHCVGLGNKDYSSKFDDSPDFVIMFLPGEVFFSSALEHDPSLIEFAIEHKVIISTPTTLLALLHAIASGWRNENLSENAKHIVEMGKELHKSLQKINEYISKMGKNLNSAMDNYQSFSSHMDKHVFAIAKEFANLEASNDDNGGTTLISGG